MRVPHRPCAIKLAPPCLWPRRPQSLRAGAGRHRVGVSRSLHIIHPTAPTARPPQMPLLPHLRAGRLLSALRPYTEAVCCVHVRRGRIGLARSDPYLSCAIAIGELRAPRPRAATARLRRALADVPVGLLLLGLPIRRGGSGAAVAAATTAAAAAPPTPPRGLAPSRRRALARALAAVRPEAVRLCAWDARTSLGSAQREQRINTQWDGVGDLSGGRPWAAGGSASSARRVCAGTHAAVALQSLLDSEMGGWPNTFG